jgi:hypothetical protein
MNDDSLMRELGRMAAEEEQEDGERFAIWERLSAGELTPEEIAALRAQAETSEEARQAYEAFRPLGTGFEARMADEIHAALHREATPAQADAETPLAAVLPFSRYARRFGGWLAAAATVAAALVAFLGRAPISPLPQYAMVVQAKLHTTRGSSPGGASTFRPGSEVEMILRPAKEFSGASDAWCCLLAQGAVSRSWPLPKQKANQSFKFDGRLGGDVEPGPWKLVAVVGRPRSLPDEATLRASLGQVRPRGPWQVLSTDVTIAP